MVLEVPGNASLTAAAVSSEKLGLGGAGLGLGLGLGGAGEGEGDGKGCKARQTAHSRWQARASVRLATAHPNTVAEQLDHKLPTLLYAHWCQALAAAQQLTEGLGEGPPEHAVCTLTVEACDTPAALVAVMVAAYEVHAVRPVMAVA
jgi:hypothetical protein